MGFEGDHVAEAREATEANTSELKNFIARQAAKKL